MKKILLITTMLISFNCLSEMTAKIIPDDSEKSSEIHEAKTQKKLEKKLSKIVKNDSKLIGKWRDKRARSIFSREKDGKVEYFKPTNFKVEFEDVTVARKEARDKAKKVKDKRDYLINKLKNKDLNLKQVNDYLRTLE